MRTWYQRGNQRRFHRVDMPINIMILPKERPFGQPIFHWGIDYFPPSIEVQIRSSRRLLTIQVDRIQEHKVFLQALFQECVQQIEFLGELIRLIAKGENPLCLPQNLKRFQQYHQGFSLIETIKSPAPRTYDWFKKIEEKNVYLFSAIKYMLQHSSATKIQSLPSSEFLIDQAIIPYTKGKYKEVPLAQSLVHLVHFQSLHFQAWQEMIRDLQWQTTPQKWSEHMVNVSTGGIAVNLPKRYPKLAHVYTKLYFPRIGVLAFEGSVVMQKSIPTEGKERIAVNFDFPTQEQQIALRTQMELFELQKAVEVFG